MSSIEQVGKFQASVGRGFATWNVIVASVVSIALCVAAIYFAFWKSSITSVDKCSQDDEI